MEQAYESVKRLVDDFRAHEHQRNQSVHELYGLTEEEIKVVEGK